MGHDGVENTKKKKGKKGKKNSADVARGDERFAAVGYDPRFQRFPKAKSKIKVDERFKDMFENPEFQVGAAKDKRGRRVDQKKKLIDDARRYYRLEDDELMAKEDSKPVMAVSSESESEFEDEASMRWARMRGLAGPSSSSSSDSDSEDEDINNDLVEGVLDDDVERLYEEWGVGAYAANPNESIPLLPEATHRLACVDLDWEHIKAVDILAALRSFVPETEGDIVSVTVYPSDYGLEKMEEEKNVGPQSIWKRNTGEDSSESDGDLDTTQLRYYERSKLRWYYAIIVCSNVRAAEAIYNECDGMELMKSANVFDLRFVPDDQSFDGRTVRDAATRVPAGYSAPVFQTKALQHTNVELTWDKVDDDRKKTLSKKFKDDELKDEDFKTYLASASDESEEEEEEEIVPDDDQEAIRARYKNLLEKDVPSERKGTKEWEVPDGSVPDTDKELQVTFTQDLEHLGAKLAEKAKEKNRKGAETVWEAYVRRRKEKREEAKKKGRVHYHSSDDNESDSDIEDAPPASGDNDDHDDGQDPFDDPFFNQNDTFVDDTKKKKQKKKHDSSEPDDDVDDDAGEEQRRAELEMLLMDDASLHTKKTGNSLKETGHAKGKMSKRARIKLAKMKKRAEREDGSDNEDLDAQNREYLNMNDPRFQEVFENPAFALDPTDPRFAKAGKGAAKLASEAAKRRSKKRPSKSPADADPHASGHTAPSEKADIKLMVASLKRKSAGSMASKKRSKW